VIETLILPETDRNARARGSFVARRIRIVIIGLALAATAGQARAAPSFERVRPVLVESCVGCHGGEKIKGGLNLTTRNALLKGGDSGPSIVPGKPDESPLFRRLTHEDDPGMPYKREKLPAPTIALFRQWIIEGAPYDQPLATTPAKQPGGERIVKDSDRRFWSFAPLQKTEPPTIQDATWARTPVDRFIRAAQESKNLTPAPEAARPTLIRRLYFDLIGLPPTPQELDAIRADTSANWYDKLVDKLLANEHFGERQARHWLDVARYADSDGYEPDADRPGMYHYRDFVIRAFNSDLPFDTFVKWQLAGDEYAPQDHLALAATGFLAAGPVSVLTIKDEGTAAERAQYRADEMDDMVSTVGSAMLGLTVGCARCHDHKYDPIPTRDYYRMAVAFTSTKRMSFSWPSDKEMDAFARPLGITDESALPVDGFLCAHGDPSRHKEPVPVGFLSVLEPDGMPDRWLVKNKPTQTHTTFQRTALAQWITDADRGAGRLLARVIVNRLWQHHFGEGLVRTPGDFGAQGDRPTHPELLDYLASELISNGWHLKHIHRLILLSAAYRQDVTFDPAKAAIDPDNRLFWRRRPMRIESETLRDAILAAGGQLKLDLYGRSIKPYIPAEARAGRDKDSIPRPGADGPDQWRRSIYLFVKRSLATPMMDVFDAPQPTQACSRRSQSTVSTQALLLLNDPFVRKQAELFAERCRKEAGSDAVARIRRAYVLALSRQPTAEELSEAVEFIGKDQSGLTNFCQVLFGLNEFAYID
jgi:hypothetical protein